MKPGELDFASGLRIRLARATDLLEIVEVEDSATQAYLATEHADAPDPPPTNMDAYRRLVDGSSVWVAELGRALVGSAVAEPAPDALHLLELAVRLSHQRQGIGRQLLQAVVAAAQARRLPAVTLTTFRGVVFNAPFYGTLGFVIPDPAPPRLRAILAEEAAFGLRDRCAMRLELPANGGEKE
jgi:GNAT superfamily N-acetyltransferase